ncbi:FtsX-like permease family protein [Oceanobacillus halophilus]|uniref:ABC transporter permease n=1 Tax=Oceanobacillus halophilus TaxID=930130 RepID=A0A495A4N5_9BACI|nr:ABC transporter permease [Oceanobacillus halophilus]RKQ34671.1 ABC transporter permease [Oceanobacillus halophilus]
MSINQLIFRNLKKNLKNYYLYVFALIFSVALYFAFVTLQFDPAMDETEGSIKGAAALKTGAAGMIAIITVFLIYANNLFIKRRSKEIGLFQLVGLTKGKIFQILSAENLLLYFGSMVVGIFLGFASSKLLMMVLIKILGIEAVAELRFSPEALLQTVIVFAGIYLVIMLMNALFIRKQRILNLFQASSKTEVKRLRISALEMIIGLLGIVFIGFGYYLSTKLFGGDFTGMNELMIAMMVILGTVIIGTYFFYKGSVSFIFNIIRKKSNGYLPINKVMSLSSIMFRMKSNSILLTVITTVSALAIGLLSLTYISYYSAEKVADQAVAHQFSIPHLENAELFIEALEEEGIDYSKEEFDILSVVIDLSDMVELNDNVEYNFDPSVTSIVVMNDLWLEDIDVAPDKSVFVNSTEAMKQTLPFNDSGVFTLKGKSQEIELEYLGVQEKRVMPLRLTNGGFPIAVVDDAVYQQLAVDKDPSVQGNFSVYVGIDIADSGELKKANDIYKRLNLDEWVGHESRLEVSTSQKQNMGLMMFLVGFLGLTFLVTSGYILYFKQMDESEEENSSYTILRKLGYTNGDLLNGIKIKQMFNFGIPLVVGLSHSYFAVKSGWFFFGTELWTPMIIVMMLYTLLYSIFGILSVLNYKKVIKEAL